MRLEHVRSALRLALVLLIFHLLQITLLARFRPWGAVPLPLPLLAVAAIYLVMVMFFTWLVGKLERRLRNSDH